LLPIFIPRYPLKTDFVAVLIDPSPKQLVTSKNGLVTAAAFTSNFPSVAAVPAAAPIPKVLFVVLFVTAAIVAVKLVQFNVEPEIVVVPDATVAEVDVIFVRVESVEKGVVPTEVGFVKKFKVLLTNCTTGPEPTQADPL
jgi:hypothetical protein